MTIQATILAIIKMAPEYYTNFECNAGRGLKYRSKIILSSYHFPWRLSRVHLYKLESKSLNLPSLLGNQITRVN